MKEAGILRAILLLTVVSGVPVCVQAYQSTPETGRHEGTGRGGRMPPPEAFSACEGHDSGDRVRFSAPDGRMISATCVRIQGQLAAVPERARGDASGRGGAGGSRSYAGKYSADQVYNQEHSDSPAEPAVDFNTTPYPVVDTGQTACYGNRLEEISCPAPGRDFYGQDAQFQGNGPAYRDNGDGTITDLVTGLMWQRSPDSDGDGDIDADDKMSYTKAVSSASNLHLGGYSDWRLPTIKELYSLINFNGRDVDPRGNNTVNQVPFINTAYFDFVYGDIAAGERIIDAQYASSTLYVSRTGLSAARTMFGVNFADGRIKGYELTSPRGRGEKRFYVRYVRGRKGYGINNFSDKGAAVTDHATGLMWSKYDSGRGMNWQDALDAAAQANSSEYLGYSDWRLPDIKELQSIVDYTRSPDTSGSAAIAPVFQTSSITNEAGQKDYPYYWSSTTHARSGGGTGAGAYIAFGRSMGYMHGVRWVDVHGAGSQRSDPKTGDPARWSSGRGPQGDAIHILNYVRLVRDAD